MKKANASKLYEAAKLYSPSGVNSPVRAFQAVGGNPVFVKKGKGCYIWDEAGTRYIDFCGSWGPLIFGHAPSGLVRRLQGQIELGTSFGTATAKEVRLAAEIHSCFPSMQKVRLVSSGTEAVMSAVRLAPRRASPATPSWRASPSATSTATPSTPRSRNATTRPWPRAR